MHIQFEKSRELWRRAAPIMPLGVNSNFRYWGDEQTPYVKRAKGAYLWDVDGNRYIDYRLAFGPIILGHAYDEIDIQVHEAIANGVLFAMTNEMEISLAEKIVAMCPAVEMVRLANSGTEATMHAIRVARAYTGREKVIKFEGQYHGFHDYMLFSTYATGEVMGNRRSPIPIPASSGIPKALQSLVITLPFNDFEILEHTLQQNWFDVAAVIVEAGLGNCAAIDPLPGWLDFIRKKCDQYGIIFILDEVKTGFRIARGGAQEVFNVQPDLATYAKSLGNGYPIAGFGGKRAVMSVIGHGVAQGGTYVGNAVAVAAANKVLDILKEEPVLETIAQRGCRLQDGLKTIFEEEGIPFVLTGFPAMFSFSLGIERVTNHREWGSSDKEFYLRIIAGLIERGVMPDNDAREPWFLSYSHSDVDIDDTLTAMREVVKGAKR